MDSSAPVQRPPLPQEILRMADDETACKFCGVSYLILSRTEKLEKLVESLNHELDLRKKYIEERPALLLKIQRSENDIVTMTQQLQESNKKADLYERQWKDISSANERLSKDLEATNSKVRYLQYKQKEKLSKLNESLTQMTEGLKIEKTRLSRMKEDVRECFSTVPTAMNDTVRRITQQLQIYYDNRQISIKNDYERQVAEYRQREIQSSEELKNREQKIEKLEMTRQKSEFKMEQMKSEISELKSAIESQFRQIEDHTKLSNVFLSSLHVSLYASGLYDLTSLLPFQTGSTIQICFHHSIIRVADIINLGRKNYLAKTKSTERTSLTGRDSPVNTKY
ncbi:hypothetical protein BKA69DRAFT_801990 [Paraphysoderma sedebokerense]|nr:hypothetical protein BKA69DRAFT_801990 [Paraphysoderma sedebokerense]